MKAASDLTGSSSQSPINVLIADDLQMIRQRLRQMLGTEQDIRIICEACNGKEVIDCLRQYSVDVLVLDLFMPEMDGYAVLKALKAEHSKIPVIIISALASAPAVKKAMAFGASLVICKENAPEELAIAIRQLSKKLSKTSSSC